jgi:hypothetical protein
MISKHNFCKKKLVLALFGFSVPLLVGYEQTFENVFAFRVTHFLSHFFEK